MAYFVSGTCVFCQRCIHECPVQAIVPGPGAVRILSEKCTDCGTCAEICPEGCLFSEDNPPVPVQPHPTIKKECDVVVLGGGGAGLVAAAKLGYFTDKKVIVLEKRRKTGGGMSSIDWRQAKTITERNPEFLSAKIPNGTLGISFKLDKKPFTDIRVRKAMNMAVDRKSIAKNIYGGTHQTGFL